MFLLIILIFDEGCSQKPKDNFTNFYPSVIQSNRLENVFDIAKFELYKINSCCECRCKAKEINTPTSIAGNMISPLSLNLDLDTINLEQDTATFYFSYYLEQHEKKIKYTIVDDFYKGCVHTYAISINTKTNQPIKCFSDENLIGYYDKEPKLKNLDFQFDKCLKLEAHINPWLKNYLIQKNK
jgi:hypothetical protein